ncbi:MAG: hypothetical protein KJ593_07390 [Candidatus Omnitrophica bacterium]|nr:hypothetical protein [Candidatus Omnitrophota bacterium]
MNLVNYWQVISGRYLMLALKRHWQGWGGKDRFFVTIARLARKGLPC